MCAYVRTPTKVPYTQAWTPTHKVCTHACTRIAHARALTHPSAYIFADRHAHRLSHTSKTVIHISSCVIFTTMSTLLKYCNRSQHILLNIILFQTFHLLHYNWIQPNKFSSKCLRTSISECKVKISWDLLNPWRRIPSHLPVAQS